MNPESRATTSGFRVRAKGAPRNDGGLRRPQRLAGEDRLKEYLFNKHAIRHQMCAECGVEVFARGKKPDGSEVVALNVSCIDGIELAKLTMKPIDGRSM